jgi:predicted MFS family arabinose efflux permease
MRMASGSGLILPASFRRLAWSSLAAQSGEQIALAAAPIVAVLALEAGAGETGLLQTALTLPFLLFAIPAGLMTDRLPRRLLMAGAEALRALSLSILLLLMALDMMTWPLLAVLGFVAVCATVAFSVAAPALVPSLVPGDLLATANARVELARTTAFAAGPAVGGFLVGWTGAAAAFGVAAILSGLAAALLSGIQEPPRRNAVAPRHPLREIREGAAFVLHHPMLGPVFLTQFIFNTAFFLILAIFVPHALHNLGLSATGVGVTLGMFGVGMVAGALLAPRTMKVLSFGAVVAIGPFAGLLGAILMALTIWVPAAQLAGLGFLLLGAGPILWVISTTTLRQTVTRPDLLGRVSAINVMAYGARPIGSALGALLGGLYGVEPCLLVAAVGFLMQAIIIARSPVVRLHRCPGMAHPIQGAAGDQEKAECVNPRGRHQTEDAPRTWLRAPWQRPVENR